MVAALGDVLEKVLIDFGKLFQRIGAVRLYERLDILTEEVVDGQSRVRCLEERVEPAGLLLKSFLRYWGCEVLRTSYVRDMILLWIRSSILSQCRDLSSGVICLVLGVKVTARAREFCSSWRRDICFCGKFR